MKNFFVVDLKKVNVGFEIVLYGWIKSKRDHGKILFFDLCDSTGSVQLIVEERRISGKSFDLAKRITIESAVKIIGVVEEVFVNKKNIREIRVTEIELIGSANIRIEPYPRSNLDIFDASFQEQLLNLRHFYLRNEKVMAILRFRHTLMGLVHQWFRQHGFVEITAPVLTPTPLYDDRSAISLEIQNQKVFLTQCVGFYLESAAHAFEKVYNIGPSFRGEESRSKRHLMEYWHIKAEIAFANLDDVRSLVEDLISDVSDQCDKECGDLAKIIGTEICTDGISKPFPCIKYTEVVSLLQKEGLGFEFGTSLGSDEEVFLSSKLNFSTPFWVVGIPRKIEPFPYVIDTDDPRVTMTADLIATEGYGELLGIAEKIYDPVMLKERMEEKNKVDNPQYKWLIDLRNYGCVPHSGFGLGVERFIRWLLRIPHVRDTIPFFRTFGRKIQP